MNKNTIHACYKYNDGTCIGFKGLVNNDKISWTPEKVTDPDSYKPIFHNQILFNDRSCDELYNRSHPVK